MILFGWSAPPALVLKVEPGFEAITRQSPASPNRRLTVCDLRHRVRTVGGRTRWFVVDQYVCVRYLRKRPAHGIMLSVRSCAVTCCALGCVIKGGCACVYNARLVKPSRRACTRSTPGIYATRADFLQCIGVSVRDCTVLDVRRPSGFYLYAYVNGICLVPVTWFTIVHCVSMSVCGFCCVQHGRCIVVCMCSCAAFNVYALRGVLLQLCLCMVEVRASVPALHLACIASTVYLLQACKARCVLNEWCADRAWMPVLAHVPIMRESASVHVGRVRWSHSGSYI